MTPPPAFDALAPTYDADFTHTPIGRLQRDQVWRRLTPLLAEAGRILEVNCGTGEDALRLAARGHEVIATDLSGGMIRTAEARLAGREEKLLVQFIRAGFLDLPGCLPEERFDLVFSNFGGLNCIGPEATRETARIFYDRLNPGGRLFLVYLSRRCLWERAYYRLKGDRERARRRSRGGPVEVSLGGQSLRVWYYHQKELADLYAPHFALETTRPVGLFVPPSYLNGAFAKREGWLRRFDYLDKKLSAFPALADYADHFVLIFEKRTAR